MKRILFAGVLAAFNRASQHTALWIGRGNRDFLIGQELADAIGARLQTHSREEVCRRR